MPGVVAGSNRGTLLQKTEGLSKSLTLFLYSRPRKPAPFRQEEPGRLYSKEPELSKKKGPNSGFPNKMAQRDHSMKKATLAALRSRVQSANQYLVPPQRWPTYRQGTPDSEGKASNRSQNKERGTWKKQITQKNER